MPEAPGAEVGLRGDALSAEPRPPVALYVHVPFCVSHCPYCDFVVYAGGAARGPAAQIERFFAALLREVELRADALDERFGRAGDAARPPLRSVYVGGGTPSLAAPALVEELLGTVRRRFGIAAGAEVTLEANPAASERGDLAAFRRAGVTRLSVGAQALEREALRRLGRRHSWSDVAAAVEEARRAGFESVSLDLLYDLPGQTLADWETALRAALALAPDHLSLYALTLDDPEAEGLAGPEGDHLPTPPGARRWRERARADQDDDRAAEQYALAARLLAAEGWRGYEISNWGRPGHESRHNLAYWLREPYEAVGPGAHAFDGQVRRWNGARLDAYFGALSPVTGPTRLPPGGEERPDEATAVRERAILALRLDTGIPDAWAAAQPLRSAADWGIEAGLLERVEAADGPRLRLTLRGRLLSNELFARMV